MGARANTPLAPSYTRHPSVAAANPSAGSFGVASVGAPPSIARGLFMPPQMTTAAGGEAPPPAVKPRAPSRSTPNAARPKKGKVHAKKNKAADSSGSLNPSRKKLAGRSTDAAATEVPTSSLIEPAADAHKVVEEMPQSFNDEAYVSTMGVGSNNSHWSQTNDMHFNDHEFEVEEDGEGIVDAPKGRGGNYTNEEDVFTALTIFH